MKEKAFGKELAIAGTVFSYRINVAIAVFLIFINAQIFAGLLMSNDPEIATHLTPMYGSLLFACIIYGFTAINLMATKIRIFGNGLEYRSLLRRRFVAEQDIKYVTFARKDKLRMQITIHTTDGKPMLLNAAKYKDNQPIIDFCARFKKAS